MKKLIALLLALALLAACAAQKTETAAAENDDVVVGFCQVGAESGWRVANTESVRAAFGEGYELMYVDGQQKQENQIRALRTFIQQEVDYIILCPIVEDGWDTVLQEAKDAGIPVIVLDRQIRVSDDSLYTAYIGSDFLAEGRLLSRWLADYLEDCGRGEDIIRIVELQGTEDSSPAIERGQGLEEAVTARANWSFAAQLQGDFTKAKAYEKMDEYLMTSRKIDVVVAQNDDMALGALQAMEERGVSFGTHEGDVLVLAYDATRAGLEACLEKKIAFVVECNPLQGERAREVIEMLERGETPPKITYIEETSFDYRTLTAEMLEKRSY